MIPAELAEVCPLPSRACRLPEESAAREAADALILARLDLHAAELAAVRSTLGGATNSLRALLALAVATLTATAPQLVQLAAEVLRK